MLPVYFSTRDYFLRLQPTLVPQTHHSQPLLVLLLIPLRVSLSRKRDPCQICQTKKRSAKWTSCWYSSRGSKRVAHCLQTKIRYARAFSPASFVLIKFSRPQLSWYISSFQGALVLSVHERRSCFDSRTIFLHLIHI